MHGGAPTFGDQCFGRREPPIEAASCELKIPSTHRACDANFRGRNCNPAILWLNTKQA